MLQRGDSVPHFEVRTVQGELFRYSRIWQYRNLVLVTLPPSASDLPGSYISQLTARIPEITAQAAECVMTRDDVAGIPSPGVVVADKWGEIAYVVSRPNVADLPSPQELLDWLAYVQTQCPECQGEAK